MLRSSSAVRRLAVARRAMSSIPSWATVDPRTMSAATPAVGQNLCGGVWSGAKETHAIVDPLNGEAFLVCASHQTHVMAY